jgi:hypothetical protein
MCVPVGSAMWRVNTIVYQSLVLAAEDKYILLPSKSDLPF